MTNELRDELAKVICFADGVHPDAIKHQFPETYYWQDYTDHAHAVIDHLTPMMKEVVGALEFYKNPSDYVAPYTSGLGKLYFDCGSKASEALTSLPACWREKESTHD